MIVPGSASPLLTTTDGGYTIAKSLRFRSSATAYLNRTPASAGNRQTWTWSGWVKRGKISTNLCLFGGTSATANSYNTFRFYSDDTFSLEQYIAGVSIDFQLRTTPVFRDPSAWYHIIVVYDSTQATSTNRVKLYVNNVQITTFGVSTYPSQNTNSYFNNNTIQYIGTTTYNGSTDQPFDGYIADVNFIDGQALTPSSFGETDSLTGVWKPKAYSGTYGTNGFYLKFTDVATTSGSNAGLGKDFSGNGNYWTTNNISVTSGSTYDSMKDVPTLTDANTANYAVLNPLQTGFNGSASLTGANLNFSANASDNRIGSTLSVSTGKWYYEVTMTSIGTGVIYVGISKPTSERSSNYQNLYWNGYFWGSDGYKQVIVDGTPTNTLLTTYATGDVIGFAFDLDAGTITAYKNNVSTITWTGVTTGVSYIPSFYCNNANMACNFGQQPFVYTPPTGYKALNTYNLPDSTIVAGNKVMDATTYTGNGSTQSITNAGSFKPDFVWVKGRTGATNHYLYDSIRGANNQLLSNATNAEATVANRMTAFNSNGFAVGTDTEVNQNTYAYVGWNWQAGQGTTSSNTSGSITSTVSVNATAGFSIVTYTGTGVSATVGHGLGVAPKLVIIKNRSAAVDWVVYTTASGSLQYLFLNLTNAATSSGLAVPTSSVFTATNSTNANANGNNYVAYCWAEIAGFSKFGSYTGNGSTNGPFVNLGFRPKFVLIKRTDTTANWLLTDSAINPYNVTSAYLYPNLSNAEATGNTVMDFVSNGFKLRADGTVYTGFNASGGTYIYAAFAENPFKNALAR